MEAKATFTCHWRHELGSKARSHDTQQHEHNNGGMTRHSFRTAYAWMSLMYRQKK
jgi:hypothetical protein